MTKIHMPNKIPKLNPQWVRQSLKYFKEFLKATKFPEPERNGTRGSRFLYPEWLIMFVAVLSVKAKAENYQAIHRLALQYWNIIAQGTKLKPIPETTLRYRLKKICYKFGKPPAFIFQIFPEPYLG
jgi:hypothetical protein